MIILSENPLNVQDAISAVQSPLCGATAVFIGTSRNNSDGKSVDALHFEAYEPMALKKMEEISVEAKAQWNVEKVAIFHRTGEVKIGEIAVVIAVSAPHRPAAFSACRFAIDRLKEIVPIWKKEIFEDGAEWVTPHP